MSLHFLYSSRHLKFLKELFRLVRLTFSPIRFSLTVLHKLFLSRSLWLSWCQTQWLPFIFIFLAAFDILAIPFFTCLPGNHFLGFSPISLAVVPFACLSSSSWSPNFGASQYPDRKPLLSHLVSGLNTMCMPRLPPKLQIHSQVPSWQFYFDI